MTDFSLTAPFEMSYTSVSSLFTVSATARTVCTIIGVALIGMIVLCSSMSCIVRISLISVMIHLLLSVVVA